jgi:hypothetical protein
MNIKLETYYLPKSWACALLYGDDSGLDQESIDAVDAFCAQSGFEVFECVDVQSDDCDFRTYHDARHVFPFACDVAQYTFTVE